MLWRNKEEFILNSYNKNHIDITVSIQGLQQYRVTGIYGEPNRAKTRETWSLIRNLAQTSTLPWCLIKDINNVLSQEDKQGGDFT